MVDEKQHQYKLEEKQASDTIEQLSQDDHQESKSCDSKIKEGDVLINKEDELSSSNNHKPESQANESGLSDTQTIQDEQCASTSARCQHDNVGNSLSNLSIPNKSDDKNSETANSTNIPDVDDAIPSGTGIVSKDCSASDLIGWSEILRIWHARLEIRPKGLVSLVKQGIPEPLRGEVWQLLCNAQQSSELMRRYPLLLVQTASAEQVILRDVNRTYPAHENFQTNNSNSLLDSLFKVCKAYAVYDEEVGYCQGLSFLVAALLLHMPEEQSFCVFVKIMQDYGLRNLFRKNFDELHLKFYQLDHLLEDQLPDLHHHFQQLGIEPFMYASQWFLTVFTAKFPLNAVFFIMDIFLLDGINTIFQVSIALLKLSRTDLLQLDFEGVLKYFRVQMPKRYIDQDSVYKLMNVVSDINLKSLKKYAKSFDLEKQKERLTENPIARLQRDNYKLTENNLRLEQENDDLARQLVASKIELRSQLDTLEDKNESLNQTIDNLKRDCKHYLNTISDMEDEKARLEVEVNQLKEVCRRELRRIETELARGEIIIKDYKKICSTLSERNEFMNQSIVDFIQSMKFKLTEHKCDSSIIELFESKSAKLVSELEQSKLPHQENQVSNNSRLVDEASKQPISLNIEDNPSDLSNSVPHEDDLSSPNKSLSSSTNSASPIDLLSSRKRIGAYLYTKDNLSNLTDDAKIRQLAGHVDELELELARTKVLLVEAECKNQQLTHDMNSNSSKVTKQATNQTSSARAKLDSVKAAATRRVMALVNTDIL